MRVKYYLFPVLLVLTLIACGTDEKRSGCMYGTISQELKTDVAWIVLEWNCKPTNGGWGSGFLIDKERGAFYTNKHVSNMFDTLGKGSQKLYFNGKMYNVVIVKVPPLTDAALIRISDNFDPSQFPEPRPVSKRKVKAGDQVYLEGYHPHPYALIGENKKEGYKELLIPIWEKYYRLGTRRIDERREIVFEKLEGTVVETDLTWERIMEKRGQDSSEDSLIESVRSGTSLFTEVRLKKDHKFSFGGLSGSPMRNARGEVIGIPTRQDLFRFDYDKEELEREGVTEGKQLFDTIFFIPIESVEELRQYLGK